MFAISLALQKQFELNAMVEENGEKEKLGVCARDKRTPSVSHALSRAPNCTFRKRPLERGPHFPGSQVTTSHESGVFRFEQGKLKKSSGTPILPSRAMVASRTTTTRGWTPEDLVALGPRMQHVPRVSAIKDSDRVHATIKEYEASGVPLIVEDWEKTPQWPGDKLFGVDWLLEHGDQTIAVRDCVTLRDKEVPFGEFIEKSRTISEYAEEDEAERLYGKDAVCPKEWRDWLLRSPLPDFLKPDGPEDILGILPEPESVETLMCYYGVGDTFTAAHKDLCASSGHNLMCSAENGGSAFWFMTRSSDAARAASYFQKLGAELDHETRIATPEEFAKAPFAVYVCEQRVGNLVLVPRRSCHQVVNHGGITAKMSWSRMSIEGLCAAFHHELPVYRRVCRSETYRVKLLVYRALSKYTEDLKRLQERLIANGLSHDAPLKKQAKGPSFVASEQSSLTALSSSSSEYAEEAHTLSTLAPRHKRLVEDVCILLGIYNKILKEEHQGDYQCEMRIPRSVTDPSSDGLPKAPTNIGFRDIPTPATLYHDGLNCDFCGADVFQSFFECRRCTNGEDNLIVCPGCYVEGRTCNCEIMTPKQQFPMNLLFEAQNKAQDTLDFYSHGKMGKSVKLSHQTVEDSVDHPGIFSAACQLLRIRSSKRVKQTSYTCRNRKMETHAVASIGALQCKKCHAARCFKHILKDGFHSSDAIKLQLSDATHEKWHVKHSKTFKVWASMTLGVRQAEEMGGPCDMRVSLVLHAEKFRSCRPMSYKVKTGWYDNVFRPEPVQTITPEPSVEGFKGAVLGEDDDELTEDDIIEVSSSDGSVYGKPVRKKPKITIRLNMKSLPSRRRTAPRNEVFVLLDRLTEEQREKFYWRGPQVSDENPQSLSESPPSSRTPGTSGHPNTACPNTVVVRRHKSARKKPPGIPANRLPSRHHREQETSDESTSDDDQVLDTRERSTPVVKTGPPSRQSRGYKLPRDASNPNRYHVKGRTDDLARIGPAGHSKDSFSAGKLL